jgi:hypothetical protein
MRALILVAAALALPLAACGNNGQTDNNANVDESLTAENIVSNDVTAIDAVTGDAANMAAESDINDVGAAPLENGNEAASSKPSKPAAKKPAPKPAPSQTAAPEPTTAPTNSAE